MPMGANFGDVDNDGYPDNEGGKKFADITASSGTGELHKGHGVALAGKSAEIVGLEIQWPGDAQPQRFVSAPNQAIEIRQSASDYRVIERPRFKLGGNRGR